MLAPSLNLFLGCIVAGAGAALGWQTVSWAVHKVLALMERA